MKSAIIYARYSSEKQTEQSIEGQLRVCYEFAKKNDLTIVDEYIDRATTGTNDNRYAFQKMLSDSDKAKWEIVLVYAIDRFGRNSIETAVNKQRLKKNGKILISATQKTSTNIDGTQNLDGILLENVMIGLAEYYSAELSQKVKRGNRESWLKGLSTGGQEVFGYDIVDKRMVVNEKEAEIVREVFTKYAQGYTVRSIVEDLQKRGIYTKKGKLIDCPNIRFILHNSRYTGIVVHDGVVYDKVFPRIIDDELWRVIDKKNQDNKISPSRKKEKIGYILSGKIICGKCHASVYGSSGRSQTGTVYHYYQCWSKRRRTKPCDLKPHRKEELEDIVINNTVKMLKAEGNVKQIAEAILRYHREDGSVDENIRLLEEKKEDAVRASKNIIRAIEQGIITEQTKERLDELQEEIHKYDAEIEKERIRTYTYLTVADVESYLMQYVFENPTDTEIRKIIINTFVRNIVLYDDKIIITYNFQKRTGTDDNGEDAIQEIEEQSKSVSFLMLRLPIECIREPQWNYPNTQVTLDYVRIVLFL